LALAGVLPPEKNFFSFQSQSAAPITARARCQHIKNSRA
jgi:hypothetical protein